MRQAALIGAVLLTGASCADDAQRDLARLCAAAEATCPGDPCPAGPELVSAWPRALARVAMDTPAGRAVRTAAYEAPLARVDAATRDAVVAAGLAWDCPALARLEAAASVLAAAAPAPEPAPGAAAASATPATVLPGAASAPNTGFATALLVAAEIFTSDADADAVVTRLARYVSRGEADFAPVAAASLAPRDAARDATDAAAAASLGVRLAAFCDRGETKCGAAAQACVTLLSRLGPRDAAGRPLLGDGSGRPMLLDEAIRALDHPDELDRRLSAVPAHARPRLHAALSGILAAAVGSDERP